MTSTAAVTATHERTISRTLAHRCAVAEVFVTSLGAVAADEFLVGAQLPRMHAYYGDHAGALADRYDPLLVMEAARQAAIALTHEFYAVPPESAFVVRTFNGTGADSAAWRVTPEPADLEMTVRVPREHRRGASMHGLDMVLDISRAGEPMLTVDGSFSWTTPGHWAAMRAGFRDGLGLGAFAGAEPPGERAPVARVGRESRRNVVIGPPDTDGRRARAAVVADPAHPFLFDHQLDHVPGSLLIEAARQTALAALGPDLPRLVCVASTFDAFVELDLPAECRVEITDAGAQDTVVHCEIHQAAAVAARIDLEFAEGAGGTAA
ncbi:ScbA/BarX family gamma-butyrolactone biosynthesis protein [Nocardia arizonensis]|uniref:ScbA/BarX family gamma-butyrolactone biosynthesis protein n=1 Tax=Nocardia arizonensis TaxID=1141647 RepID=UPI0006D08CF4|nr:ScbA/BarX family gamma-butyrolactone biosynthesis protein [Nocardia arizonensis]